MYFLDSFISQVGDLILTIELMFYSLPYLYSSISSEDIYLSSIRELVSEDISKQGRKVISFHNNIQVWQLGMNLVALLSWSIG